MKLSPHFTLAELTASSTARARGIDNSPPEEVLPRLIQLAEMLEGIRSHLGGRPITITSGYRSPALNRAVGGVATSDHTRGDAADWVCPAAGSPLELCRSLAPHVSTLGVGQLIYESIRRRDGRLSEWVHVSTRVPPVGANRVITITEAGTQLGIQERTA